MIRETVAVRSVAPQPWRNGGGVTRELLTWPHGDAWKVRVSVADIDADGPFSVLEGVERWFAVLEGEGVALEFAEGVRQVTRDDPALRFDGASAPMCRLLGGPTRDLNLMLRGASGSMAAAFDHRPWSPAGDACALFALTDGVIHAQAQRERVAAMSLLVCEQAVPALRFAADVDAGGPFGWWLHWSASKQ